MIPRRWRLLLLLYVLIAALAATAYYLLTYPPRPAAGLPTVPPDRPVAAASPAATAVPLPRTAMPLPSPTPAPRSTAAPLPSPTGAPLPGATPSDLAAIARQASRAMVLIEVPVDNLAGSGSIVDGERGLILTCWHVVGNVNTGELYGNGSAAVYLTVDPDGEPVLSYWAQVLTAYSDPKADLALLEITHGPDRAPVASPFGLPSVALGDSDSARWGDPVVLLGYPDYGNRRVSVTKGEIVTRDDEWITGEAFAAHGSSGGMMLNARGELIGIPAELRNATQQGALVRARPSNQAQPLIAAAWAGAPAELPADGPIDPYAGAREVVMGVGTVNLRAAPGAEAGVVAELPRGTELEITGAPASDGEQTWYPVRVPAAGQEGWVSAAFLASGEMANDQIVLASDRSGNSDLYAVSPLGAGWRQLTDDPGNEIDPSWRGGDDYVILASDREGSYDLYALRVENGDWIPLTGGVADDVHPVLSPDGSRIAFVSDRDGDWEVFLYQIGDRSVDRLTFNDAGDRFPSWSPDGSRLVFVSDRTGNLDLYVLELASRREVQLTNDPGAEDQPAWSPVADQIAYTMVVIDGGVERRAIGVIDLDDPAHPRRVTVAGAADALYQYPDWSPDGQWIVFTSRENGDEELCLVPAAGGRAGVLVALPGSNETMPAWSR